MKIVLMPLAKRGCGEKVGWCSGRSFGLSRTVDAVIDGILAAWWTPLLHNGATPPTSAARRGLEKDRKNIFEAVAVTMTESLYKSVYYS